ncbi:hypothetical protein C8R43DRAFT_1110378 [Mycena crocata]|nr:hypothetical protein C8R43DRAFT_1110378 [Mycena crocata]
MLQESLQQVLSPSIRSHLEDREFAPARRKDGREWECILTPAPYIRGGFALGNKLGAREPLSNSNDFAKPAFVNNKKAAPEQQRSKPAFINNKKVGVRHDIDRRLSNSNDFATPAFVNNKKIARQESGIQCAPVDDDGSALTGSAGMVILSLAPTPARACARTSLPMGASRAVGVAARRAWRRIRVRHDYPFPPRWSLSPIDLDHCPHARSAIGVTPLTDAASTIGTSPTDTPNEPTSASGDAPESPPPSIPTSSSAVSAPSSTPPASTPAPTPASGSATAGAPASPSPGSQTSAAASQTPTQSGAVMRLAAVGGAFRDSCLSTVSHSQRRFSAGAFLPSTTGSLYIPLCANDPSLPHTHIILCFFKISLRQERATVRGLVSQSPYGDYFTAYRRDSITWRSWLRETLLFYYLALLRTGIRLRPGYKGYADSSHPTTDPNSTPAYCYSNYLLYRSLIHPLIFSIDCSGHLSRDFGRPGPRTSADSSDFKLIKHPSVVRLIALHFMYVHIGVGEVPACFPGFAPTFIKPRDTSIELQQCTRTVNVDRRVPFEANQRGSSNCEGISCPGLPAEQHRRAAQQPLLPSNPCATPRQQSSSISTRDNTEVLRHMRCTSTIRAATLRAGLCQQDIRLGLSYFLRCIYFSAPIYVLPSLSGIISALQIVLTIDESRLAVCIGEEVGEISVFATPGVAIKFRQELDRSLVFKNETGNLGVRRVFCSLVEDIIRADMQSNSVKGLLTREGEGESSSAQAESVDLASQAPFANVLP